MIANTINSVAVPLSIYLVAAVCCWLSPARYLTEDGTVVTNIFPTQAFALASGALAVFHFTLSLRGCVVVAVAVLWAIATISTVTMFYLSPFVSLATWSAIQSGQALVVAVSACGLLALAWHVAHRRLFGSNAIVRALIVSGLVLLALCYATLGLRGLGVLWQPEGFEQMAEVMAGLTVDLWINSAVVLLGAASHAVLSRCTRDKAA